jgi:hypothetical protein
MTAAEKYNKKLFEITEPEIDRVRKSEKTAKVILDKLNEKTNIDYCGLEEWQLVNMIAPVIREAYNEFEK